MVLLIGSIIPFLESTSVSTTNIERSAGYGLSDISIFGRYNLYQTHKPTEIFRITGQFGLYLPTGKDDSFDNIGKLPPTLQRGKGSISPSILLIASKLWHNFAFHNDIGYTYSPEANNIDYGDILKFDSAISYRFLTTTSNKWNAILELNGTYTKKLKNNNILNHNSGGTVVYASPGIQFIHANLMIEASIQIPVIESLNGNPAFKPDYTALLGFRINNLF